MAQAQGGAYEAFLLPRHACLFCYVSVWARFEHLLSNIKKNIIRLTRSTAITKYVRRVKTIALQTVKMRKLFSRIWGKVPQMRRYRPGKYTHQYQGNIWCGARLEMERTVFHEQYWCKIWQKFLIFPNVFVWPLKYSRHASPLSRFHQH